MRAGNHSFEILLLYASLYLVADGDNKKPRTGNNAEHIFYLYPPSPHAFTHAVSSQKGINQIIEK